MSVQRRALVLNQNYEPLNVCSVRRAFVLVFHGKAEVLESGEGSILGASDSYDTPSVIRLRHFVRRPHPRPRLSRREVFARDQERCQYCGRRGGDLTLDTGRAGARRRRRAWSSCRSLDARRRTRR